MGGTAGGRTSQVRHHRMSRLAGPHRARVTVVSLARCWRRQRLLPRRPPFHRHYFHPRLPLFPHHHGAVANGDNGRVWKCQLKMGGTYRGGSANYAFVSLGGRSTSAGTFRDLWGDEQVRWRRRVTVYNVLQRRAGLPGLCSRGRFGCMTPWEAR